MIVVKIFGGLGNQMFQYAAGRSISIELNQPLQLEINSGFQDDFYKRDYCLNHFTIIENIISKKDLPPALFGQSSNKNLLKRWIRNLYYRYTISNWKVHNEKNIFFNNNVFQKSEHIFLNGYWQSAKYFNKHIDQIRQDFTLKNPLTGINKDMETLMGQTNSVCLHIRRLHGISGGIVSSAHAEVHGALGINFYSLALDYLEDRIKDITIFVFSDDIAWAKENMKLKQTTYYMDQNDDAHNYADLILMSKCKHQIIANSTFSWWGAYLNINPDKIVIAPKIWFVDPAMNSQTADLIPENWIRF